MAGALSMYKHSTCVQVMFTFLIIRFYRVFFQTFPEFKDQHLLTDKDIFYCSVINSSKCS